MRRMALLVVAVMMALGVVALPSASAQSSYPLPAACANKTGKVICASKKAGMVYALKNGKVVWATGLNRQAVESSRYGGVASDGSGPWYTREGTFKIFRKKADAFSTLYFVPMPYFMAFSGGQGIHYSSEFARGYPYSHGCVGLKSKSFAKWLYYWAPLGTRVIVTRN